MMSEMNIFDLLELNLTDLWRPASIASAQTCVELRIAAQRRKGRRDLKLLNVPEELRASLVPALHAQGHQVIVGHLIGEIYVLLAP
jgi:hypothetical protein